MRRFANWLRGLFGHRQKARISLHPMMRFTTDDGTVVKNVTQITCRFEGGHRHVTIEIVTPLTVDK